MSSLNPYESPRTETEPLDTARLPRAFRVRVVILLAGTVSSIVAGLAAEAAVGPYALVVASVIMWGAIIAATRPHHSDEAVASNATRERARLTVGLIWTILPIGALMHAYEGVSGSYDPVRDDGYPNSLTVWWSVIGATLLTAVVLTLLYAFHPRAAAMRPVNRFVVASWGIQLLSIPVRFYFKL